MEGGKTGRRVKMIMEGVRGRQEEEEKVLKLEKKKDSQHNGY